MMMLVEEDNIINLLKEDNEKAIDLLFDNYYSYLCNIVLRVINDENFAEDIVQEMFMDIWKKRHELNIQMSLRAYLRRAAVNRSLNHLRKQKMKFEDSEEATLSIETEIEDGQASLEREELEQRIFQCIDALPSKCKIVFSLSRFEGMSYQEIADQLNISVKTVENQISKALKLLRKTVQSYMVFLFILIVNFFL